MLFPALETCGVLVWCLDRTGHGRDILRRPCVYGLVAFGLDDYSAYIGSTKHLGRRLREHVWDARMALRGTLPSAVTSRMLGDPIRAPGALLAIALQTDGLEKLDARHDAELIWMLAANQNGVRPVNK
ncbi:MAG TPA: hypothetical protein VMF53_17350 [Alphaproteobacteria bacterium]|nr:hypothetical protein [Alphaproteobacteria bacterium]